MSTRAEVPGRTAPVRGRRPWPSLRLLAGIAALVAINVGVLTSLVTFDQDFGLTILAAGVAFVALASINRQRASKLPVVAIVVITTVVQLIGVLVAPITSDDSYRYVWDGRVQLAGIDPYRYPPEDPALVGLRDPILFPADRAPRINRPGAHTIYPPVAQAYFALVALVTPVWLGVKGIQLAAVAAVVTTTGLLARLLGSRRRLALLYGANPAVMVEAGNGGHLDAVVALAMLGFVWAAQRRRHWLAGGLLFLAAGMKLVPLLLLPVLLRRGRWRSSLTALSGLALSYLPHLLAVGGLVVGFLPRYLEEEGYDTGRRFAMFAFLPQDWRPAAALAVAGVVAVAALVRSRAEPVLLTVCWLYGSALLVASSIYAWYALPFVVVVLLAGRLEWLAVWVAMYVAFVFDREVAVQAGAFWAALLVVLGVGCARWCGHRVPDGPRSARPLDRRDTSALPSEHGGARELGARPQTRTQGRPADQEGPLRGRPGPVGGAGP